MTQQSTSLAVGAALPTVMRTITQQKIDAYALASGDGNPLHTDPAFAANTQFGGTIAHGMLLLGYVSEMMTAAFGEDWLTGGRLKVRFRATARPGDTLTSAGTVTSVEGGKTVCAIECRNESGEVLVSGQAEVSRS
ncbi:MAG: MaoC family dehydratase [Chloroflexi bacterium]|nr:MaoC family dehydratase [Chloroflexota bacterium]